MANLIETVHVNLGPRSYDIVIGTNTEDSFVSFLRERLKPFSQVLVIGDTNTQSLATKFAELLNTEQIAIIPAGETSKSLEFASTLYSRLAQINADRKTPVIAIGGGVVGDLGGFVAATYNRGLPLVMIPTTLLAMVDSSVGGKVGINLTEGKNLVGSFHQPSMVWIDTEMLRSLPDREYFSGLAEVVKYGVILDVEFFEWIEKNTAAIVSRDPLAVRYLVNRSCRLKADVVEKDEREENGLRMALNYGHTFAHAFESVGGYGSWLHGEAVSAGMICASRLAESKGLISESISKRQMEILSQFRLPLKCKPDWSIEKMIAIMRRDKKNVGGRMRFILPVRLGEVKAFDDVDESTVREILNN